MSKIEKYLNAKKEIGNLRKLENGAWEQIINKISHDKKSDTKLYKRKKSYIADPIVYVITHNGSITSYDEYILREYLNTIFGIDFGINLTTNVKLFNYIGNEFIIQLIPRERCSFFDCELIYECNFDRGEN